MKQLFVSLIICALFATSMFANRVAYATDIPAPTIGPDETTVSCSGSYINYQTSNGAHVEYKARWTANQYTVKFNPNAEDATGDMDPEQYTYDVTGNLPQNEFAVQGYYFVGWCKGHSYCADAEVIEDEADVLNWSATQDDEIELFAQWTPACVALLHIGNDSLCLYKSKITAPSLAIRTNTNVYYAAMSPIGDNTKTINSTSNKKLHVRYGEAIYNVHDYSVTE